MMKLYDCDGLPVTFDDGVYNSKSTLTCKYCGELKEDCTCGEHNSITWYD